MNNISITGRIANDLAIRYTANNNAVLNFTVAVRRPHTKDNTTDWINCVAWRETAEFIEKWFIKGKMIAITGTLTSRSWKDDAGKNHQVHEVLVDNAEFCGGKKAEEAAKEETASADVPPAFASVDEEEIPF